MAADRRHLAIEVVIEDIHHGLGRQPVRQRGEAAQIRQPDRGMHGVGVAAPDLAAHDALAGAVADIGVEQARGGAAQADDLDHPRQRPHDRSQRGQFLVAEAAGLIRGPARRVGRAVDEQQRQRDIIGDTFAAHVVEERKALALGIVEAIADLPPLSNMIASGLLLNSGESRNSKSALTYDLGSRPPEEVAAENIGMQGPDENRDAPQRQACRDQPLADLRHQLRRPVRGPRAVDQPVGEVLQLGRVHEASICGAVCGNVKAMETRCACAARAAARMKRSAIRRMNLSPSRISLRSSGLRLTVQSYGLLLQPPTCPRWRRK